MKLTDGLNFTNGNLTTTDVAPNGVVKVNVTVGTIDTENGKVKNAKDGVATVADVVNAINNSGWNVTAGDGVDGGKVEGKANQLVNPGSKVTLNAGKNMKLVQKDGEFTFATQDDVDFNSISVGKGDNKVKLSSSKAQDGTATVNLSNGEGKPVRISNIAAGVNDTDAVNVGQLRGAVQNVQNNFNKVNARIDDVDKSARAGTAAATAIATLPQEYRAGRSQFAAAAAHFKGQSALAVGYSRVSDNSKWIIRFTGSTNSQKDTAVGVGAGYSW